MAVYGRRVIVPTFEISNKPSIGLGEIKRRRFGGQFTFARIDEPIQWTEHIARTGGIFAQTSGRTLCGKDVKESLDIFQNDTDPNNKSNVCSNCLNLWNTEDLVEK